jgi:hypothetical protein
LILLMQNADSKDEPAYKRFDSGCDLIPAMLLFQFICLV